MMKKIFEEPLCEIARFEVEDVVTRSDQWYTDEFGVLSVEDIQ